MKENEDQQDLQGQQQEQSDQKNIIDQYNKLAAPVITKKTHYREEAIKKKMESLKEKKKVLTVKKGKLRTVTEELFQKHQQKLYKRLRLQKPEGGEGKTSKENKNIFTYNKFVNNIYIK